ncbi:tRNA lysidine(34) synthetase TilS [Carboxylicivirga mesophila]|uniref:tRNA(Ile)-lysidine synthase n=1 Tax=Carboxylicivirga mesophila TaxID=1166478 RepID=A0ABS5K7Z3_9BACT|nr:tRNA lysidine(34) synthetase TilS [Carboxylicivirga mesophila]MBS2211109.1 tRNA lysidine(34) synthetase TilS [Carboxylicivirga mesophila]
MYAITPQTIQNVLAEKCQVTEADKLLVAVSGGADSMALLHLLQQAGYQLAAAHCNFQLRGDASDSDEQLVTDYCNAHAIQLNKTTFDTRKYAADNKFSIEMAARELRYNWFQEIVNNEGYNAIVTGHHGNDSIETFFLNLVRGTGVKGLTGISFRNNNIVRPLLPFTREQIERYCEKNNLDWCHDASNDDCRFIRNKLRHELIPVLESINPAFFDTMQMNMAHLQDTELMLEEEVERFRTNEVVDEEGTVIIPISKLKLYPYYASLLFELLRPYGFNSSVVKEVLEHLEGLSGKQFFSDSYRLIKDRHNLLVLPIEEIGVQHFWVEEGLNIGEQPMKIQVYDKPADFSFSRKPELIHLDADLVDLPLLVRKWKQGDAFMPLGMKNFKKLSDFFIDEKYSLKDKEDAWLMLSGESIVWVLGKRIDERYKVMKRTKRILEIQLQ